MPSDTLQHYVYNNLSGSAASVKALCALLSATLVLDATKIIFQPAALKPVTIMLVSWCFTAALSAQMGKIVP